MVMIKSVKRKKVGLLNQLKEIWCERLGAEHYIEDENYSQYAALCRGPNSITGAMLKKTLLTTIDRCFRPCWSVSLVCDVDATNNVQTNVALKGRARPIQALPKSERHKARCVLWPVSRGKRWTWPPKKSVPRYWTHHRPTRIFWGTWGKLRCLGSF